MLDLIERVYGKSLLFVSPADQTKAYFALYGIDPETNGTVSIPITLATGETVNLPFNQNTHFIIRLVDQVDIPNPDFENTSFPNYQTTPLKSVTTVDVSIGYSYDYRSSNR